MSVLFFIYHSKESKDAEGWLYALIYAIFIGHLNTCGLWYLQGPGTNPPQVRKDNVSFGGVKSYTVDR